MDIDEKGLSKLLDKTIQDIPLNGTMKIKISGKLITQEHKDNLKSALEKLIIVWRRTDIKIAVIELGLNDLN